MKYFLLISLFAVMLASCDSCSKPVDEAPAQEQVVTPDSTAVPADTTVTE